MHVVAQVQKRTESLCDVGLETPDRLGLCEGSLDAVEANEFLLEP